MAAGCFAALRFDVYVDVILSSWKPMVGVTLVVHVFEAGARGKLPADKAATREDAERVPSAEVRNRPDMATTPGGVADAVTAAARLNQERPTRSF
ncbi:hypothetical protein OsI_13498 [Oryza sativa Indica Group]|uniref:SMP domain-containing protein n=1 Tax=Oryza sativa subsp. indica TaxID=39946 RepID=B8AJV5_ORYSI|nr:hypothetical protein OsI_13498 [Oryza sativa Indica Group]